MKPRVMTDYYENGQKNYEEHWLNGKLHNETGPAYQSWYSTGQKCDEEYWLNGRRVTKERVMTAFKIKKFLDEDNNK